MKLLKILPELCTGCMSCELACSYHLTGLFQPSRAVIRVAPLEAHTSYAPYACLQCGEGWCMTACPVDAIFINAAGAKAVDGGRCVGCKLCTIACPFGTIFLDSVEQTASKCDLCGGAPACATVCPVGAILYTETEPADWLGSFAGERSAFDLTGRARTGRE